MDTKKLRQKILDLAIRGKLVPQDPNDEPASVLLERIRVEKERLIKEGKIKRSKKSTSDTPHYENRQVGEANEAPFEVSKSWEWTTIGKLCSFLSRGKSPKYSEERKYPVFAQKCNLYDGDISLEKARFLDPETIIKWSDEYKLIDGDILVNSTGTGTVGRTRLFHSDVLGDYPFVVPDSHVSVVRTFEEIESKFVLAFLSSDYGQTYIEDNLAGSTNQKELYIGILDNMLFPLPPHEEQLRIVTAIDKWFSLINVLESAKGDLQISIAQAKSKILDLAIHGKLVPQDPNDEPAIELLSRINPRFTPCDNAHYENVPFEIPKSWRWTCMAEVNEYNSASVDPSKSPDNDFELYSVPAYETGMPEFVKGKDISSSKKSVSKNDVLLCKINPHLNRAWIVSHYKENRPCLASSEWIIFRNSSIIPQYLSFCFTSNYFKELMLSNVSGVGGSLMRAQPAIVNKYLFPLPPINEQCRIVAAIQEYYEILDNICANL